MRIAPQIQDIYIGKIIVKRFINQAPYLELVNSRRRFNLISALEVRVSFATTLIPTNPHNTDLLY